MVVLFCNLFCLYFAKLLDRIYLYLYIKFMFAKQSLYLILTVLKFSLVTLANNHVIFLSETVSNSLLKAKKRSLEQDVSYLDLTLNLLTVWW